MYKFNPATGVLILQGKWTSGMFRKLIDQLGLSNIKRIVVDAYSYLSVDNMTLENITVDRTGYFTCNHCIIRDLASNGVVRARYSILTSIDNDGQIYLTCRTHARHIENRRHLNLSQSFVGGLRCYEHSSVKATNSYIACSDADNDTVLCLGSSAIVSCTGLFKYWSNPSMGAKGFKSFTPEMQLRVMVIEVLCTIDYIDSGFNYTDQRTLDLVIEIAKYLNNDVSLVWDLAREFGARVEFPTHIKKGKRTVPFNTVHARDNLVKFSGLFNI